jgi:PAS domain S-box-containing protein
VPFSSDRKFRLLNKARRLRKRPVFAYGLALAAVGLATLLRWEIALLGPPGSGVPFTTYYLAIIVATIAGGLGAGLLAVVLSALSASLFFMPPLGNFNLSAGQLTAVAMFLLVSGAIVLTVHLMNSALDWSRDQEANIRGLIESAPNGMVVVDENGRIIVVNEKAEALFGYARSELIGQPIELLVPPSKAAEHAGERTRFIKQPAPHIMGRGREITARRKSGSEFPVEVALNPVKRSGLVGVVATVVDISERKEAQEHQRVLVRELQHRTQNLFSVIKSIATRTLNNGKDRKAFESRLMAMARAHDLLAHTAFQGAPLVDLIAAELKPYGEKASLSGCDLFVNPTAAQQFALIMHELATNAAKHGALSVPDGKVTVEGRVHGADGDRTFILTWKERDGPRVSQPRRKGFGSVILLESAKRFGTDAKLSFEPEGLSYELQLPVGSIESTKGQNGGVPI